MLTEQAHALVDQFAKALELVGVAIILGGIILATVRFLRDGSRTPGTGDLLILVTVPTLDVAFCSGLNRSLAQTLSPPLPLRSRLIALGCWLQ